MTPDPTANGFASRVRSAALALAARGVRVVLNHVPKPGGECSCGRADCGSPGKHPRGGDGWPDRATSDPALLGRQLGRSPVSNLGAHLTDGLADIDLDHPAAARAAEVIMPVTGMIAGRPGAPRSHRFYHSPGLEGADYADPVMVASGDKKRAKLVEVRVKGQTVLPPSVHWTGEVYRWDADGDPAAVTPADLARSAAETAAAALVGKYWQNGGRHDASLPLGGWLRRNGWEPDRIGRFVRAVCAAGNDPDPDDRVRAALDSAAKLDAGEKVTGLPTLVKALGSVGEDVTRAVAKWLNLRTTGFGPKVAVGGGNSLNSVWGVPVPLTTPPAVPEFPTSLLPEWLRAWVEAVATHYQVPADLPAGLGLGLIGAGLARKVACSPRDGFVEPVNLYVMAMLAPGERKTATFKQAIAPVQKLQAEAIEEARPKIQEAESDLRIAEKRVKHLEDKIAKADTPADREALREELQEARKELAAVEVPPEPLFYTEDDTPESLKAELVRQGGRMMVATTEAKCLENITLYSDRPNFDVYLKGHAGDEMNSGRVTRGRDRIDNPALSCLLSPQPAVARGLAENEILRGRGFLARWLYQLPASRVGSRAVAAPTTPDAVQQKYDKVVTAAWKIEYAADEFGKPAQHVLRLDDGAAAVFAAFESWIEPRLAVGGTLARLAGWGNKLAGACARLSAILHVADCLGRGEGWDVPIPAAVVRRAVRLCRGYYVPHAVAAFDLMGTNQTTVGARRVWAWVLRKKLTAFTKRDAFRENQGLFETVDELQPCLDLLERHHLIRPQGEPAGPRGRGRPSSPAYEVNPAGGGDDDRYGGRGEPDPPDTNDTNDTNPPDTNSVISVNSVRGDHSGREVGPNPDAGEAPCRSVTDSRATAVGDGGGGAQTEPTGSNRSPGSEQTISQDVRPHDPTASPAFTLVADAAALTALADAVAGWDELVGLDTETTGLDPRTDRVRLLQLAVGEDVAVIDLFAFPDPAAALAPLFGALSAKEVVGHNVLFDLAFLARLGFAPGSVRDCMLASQVVHAGGRNPDNSPVRHALKDVAARALDLTLDKADQKADWSRTLTPEMLRYAARDAEVPVRAWERLAAEADAAGLSAVLADEMRALSCVAWAARHGVGFDRAAWEALAAQAEAERDRLACELDDAAPNSGTLTGTRNWNSAEQVTDAFAALGVTLDSTDDGHLAALDHPLAELLRDYRAAAKRAGTYGKAWLKHVTPDGRVYAAWTPLGAESSGRMSCSKPNLQNLPRDPRYRRCFVAPPGRVLVKADYSQIELRIAAKVSGDERMLAAYRGGEDIHTLTVAAVLGKPIGEVTRADRQLAKAINFGLLYGMGARALVGYARANYGVTLTEAEAAAHRNTFFKTYPGLRRWHRSVKDGPVETRTLCGRRRLNVTAFAEKLNTPVQGTGADGLKRAMALLWDRRADCSGAFPVLFVHDEIVIETTEGNAATAAEWLRRAMADAMAPIIDPVPVEVEVTVGKSWGG